MPETDKLRLEYKIGDIEVKVINSQIRKNETQIWFLQNSIARWIPYEDIIRKEEQAPSVAYSLLKKSGYNMPSQEQDFTSEFQYILDRLKERVVPK